MYTTQKAKHRIFLWCYRTSISKSYCSFIGQSLSNTPLVIGYSQWRSQKFSTGGALICGFPSYCHNPSLVSLIHYNIQTRIQTALNQTNLTRRRKNFSEALASPAMLTDRYPVLQLGADTLLSPAAMFVCSASTSFLI